MNSTFGAIGKATTDKLTETVDGKTSSFGFMYQSIPKPPIPPRAMPGHLTRVKLHIVGNLTQNEAPPGGTFDFRVKTSVGGRKQKDHNVAIEFFDSARETRSRVIALVDFTWVFLLLSFYVVISWNRPFYSCLPSDLAFEWQRGWRWPCFDTDLTAFVV